MEYCYYCVFNKNFKEIDLFHIFQTIYPVFAVSFQTTVVCHHNSQFIVAILTILKMLCVLSYSSCCVNHLAAKCELITQNHTIGRLHILDSYVFLLGKRKTRNIIQTSNPFCYTINIFYALIILMCKQVAAQNN